jgi:hypothetical protein
MDDLQVGGKSGSRDDGDQCSTTTTTAVGVPHQEKQSHHTTTSSEAAERLQAGIVNSIQKRHFLRNRLLEALRNHQRPLLVNNCTDIYSHSNKQSLHNNKRTQLFD